MTMRLFLVSTLAAFALCSNAQELPAAKIFADAPDKLVYGVSKNTRLDMLDYYHAGVDRASTNDFNGECQLMAEDSLSISYRLTEDILCQMFLLNPDTPAQIVGIITTYPTPIPDSKIAFYDKDWQPLDKPVFAAPKLGDWLTAEGRKQRRDVEDAIPFILSQASYDPQSQTLTYTLTLDQFYLPTDTPPQLSMLRKQLSYKWNGKKFVSVQ